MGEFINGLVGVVHGEHDTRALKLEDFHVFGLAAIFRGEGHGEGACLLGDEVGGAVLVTEGVSSNHDWRGPSGHTSWDVADDDGLTEDGAAENVADGAVGGLPHLLKVELGDTLLIGSNRSALDADLAGFDGVSAVKSDLIVGGIAVLDAQVEVLDVKVQVRMNKLKSAKERGGSDLPCP